MTDTGLPGGGNPHGVIENIYRFDHREGAAGIALGEGEQLTGQSLGRHAGGLGIAQLVEFSIVFRQGDAAQNG